MQNKYKISLILVLGLFIFSLAVTSVLAGELNISGKLTNVGTAAGFGDEKPNLAVTVGKIIQGLLSLLGIVFMGYIIYAGSIWITARGEEERITKAKAIIRNSIIGLIIVFSAYAITAFVLDRIVEGTGFTR